MGLYNYDQTIFDEFIVPEEMDRDVAISEILSQCAELELVYPDLEVMRTLIRNWTIAELPLWTRAYNVMTMEYNPIWNKDGTITETLTVDRHLEKKGTGSVTTENDFTDTNVRQPVTTTTKPVTNTTTKSVMGYNETDWADAEKNVDVLGQIENTTGTITDTLTHTTNKNKVTEAPEFDDHDHGTETTTRTEQGNIGVTTSQFMVESEVDLIPKLNPYQFIVNSFKNRFCLLVY